MELMIDPRKLLTDAREHIGTAVCEIFNDLYNVKFEPAEISKDCARPPKVEQGDFCIACFQFSRKLKPFAEAIKAKNGLATDPPAVATALGAEISKRAEAGALKGFTVRGHSAVKSVVVEKAWVNITFNMDFHAQAVMDIVTGKFLEPLTEQKKDTVMIEYSQPNTHKAFHVGHMRNAALGDCLVRLYEQMGHKVTAVNYFGDEGAHVAKCLWYLQKHYLPTVAPEVDVKDVNAVLAYLDTAVPAETRAEWLGNLYTQAVLLLDLSVYTSLPYKVVIAGKVLSKDPHPASDAPANWNVVKLQIAPDDDSKQSESSHVTVVCGGKGYNVGDMVAYLPVGKKLTKKQGVIEPKDMKGVMSYGMILAEAEVPLVKEGEETNPETGLPVSASEEKKGDVKDVKKGKDGKPVPSAPASASGPAAAAAGAISAKDQIRILPADSVPGISIAEIGRFPSCKVPGSVLDYVAQLEKEAGDQLLALEHGQPDQVKLWRHTGQWSLDAFKEIYAWIDCRFDHDFCESEVSEASQKFVDEMLEKGHLTRHNGAVVADLTQYNLGRCTLRKSNGAGLYATKDLALAQRKFDQFHIDKSIYVVDQAQTFHFQQVFKTLEICGYEQAKKCVHLPYGLVVLPSGKMSSRKGNVLLFSELRSEMKNALTKNARDVVPSDEVIRRVAVAAIKYGMLNHDTSSDIVFDMPAWLKYTGNTGPYLMYAYSRMMSLFACRSVEEAAKFNNKFDILTYLSSKGIEARKFGVPSETSPVPVFDLPAFLASDEAKAFVQEIDFNKHLDDPTERPVLLHLHKFWDVVASVTALNNPSTLCDYGFNLAQLFSSWYESVRFSDLVANTPEKIPTKLVFMLSMAKTIKRLLFLLGITSVDKM